MCSDSICPAPLVLKGSTASESIKKAPKRASIVLGIIISILAALAIAAFCWINNYYHADEVALAVIADDAELMTIEDGNHAGYGNYGKQNGDGTATISSEQQQRETADAIEALVKAA